MEDTLKEILAKLESLKNDVARLDKNNAVIISNQRGIMENQANIGNKQKEILNAIGQKMGQVINALEPKGTVGGAVED